MRVTQNCVRTPIQFTENFELEGLDSMIEAELLRKEVAVHRVWLAHCLYRLSRQLVNRFLVPSLEDFGVTKLV